MKLGYNKVFAIAASAILLASCDFLDVAPAQRATFADAMKNKTSIESWLYGTYQTVASRNPTTITDYEASTDEFVCPDLWSEYARQVVAYCTVNASNMPDSYFRTMYGEIGNVHLFLRELDAQNPDFLTDADKTLYRAHINFLEGYYYSKILNYFGPCPIVEQYVGVSTTKDQFPGRYHYDYVVDYIVNKLDAAYNANVLPSKFSLDSSYGLANQTACAALKSRVLLYAASPLWNGGFPWVNWTNEGKFETPGYGNELVSKTFDINKWYRAKTAAQEAIAIALKNGRELLDVETAMQMAERDKVPYLPSQGGNYLPGIDTSTPEGIEFAKRVLLMRYLSASDETLGNKEFIFTCFDTSNGVRAGKPRNIIKNNSGNWVGGWSGCSPTLNIVEQFYTKDGKLPAKDPNFAPQSEWLKSAGLDRSEIINLNAKREPRFYAWITFDGADIGPLINNGKPLRVNYRQSAAQTGVQGHSGYDKTTARDLNQTGYGADKYFSPKTIFNATSQNFGGAWPAPLIRLAELYLNLAECCAEIYMNTGDQNELQMAIDNLNVIRRRAGIPEISKADCTDNMTIREWVRSERTVELYMEGHRYYDVRRWCLADKYFGAKVRQGLDAFVSRRVNPTFEQFNTRVVVDGDYKWLDRMYLLPIRNDELYSNPQMVQAPGY